jgi:isocitrate dehydrogenase
MLGACKNYDGDVLYDCSLGYGSLAMRPQSLFLRRGL